MKINLSSRYIIVFVFILIAITSVIYFPSLYHLPRADQFCYLLDTIYARDLTSLIKDFYSYNRVRVVNPGDVLLFRPVFFSFLGLEKYLFGTDFFYWQMIGLLLHLGGCIALLKLLLRIDKSYTAFPLVLFFSTLHTGQEMVIWHHIHGYLLFLIFVLLALDNLIALLEENRNDNKRAAMIFVYLLAACFAYEAGIIYCLLLLFFFYLYKKKQGSYSGRLYFIFLAPAVIYSLAYLADLLYRLPYFFEYHTPVKPFFSLNTFLAAVKDSFVITYKWLLFGLFPSIYKLNIHKRFFISIDVDLRNIRFTWEIILNLISVTALFIYYSRTVSLEAVKRNLRLIGLLILMYFSFMEIIVFGRTAERGLWYILGNSTYYGYFAWIFFILILYSAVDRKKAAEIFSGYTKYVAGGFYILLVCLNCFLVYDINRRLADQTEISRKFFNTVRGYVKEHKNEPDFSFNFSEPAKGDGLYFPILGRLPAVCNYSDILFGNYINKKRPKYTIEYKP